MSALEFNLDTRGIDRIAAAMRQASNRTPDAIRRALNWSGERARTQVARALTKQTGLKFGTIRRALKERRANYGALVYRIVARGGDIALKYFGTRETRKGVSAAPWGKRSIYPGTFIKGGLFPDRKALNLGGQVFRRIGSGRAIGKVKSGLYIPEEMVKGQSAATFEATVAAVLPGRVEHEVARVIP